MRNYCRRASIAAAVISFYLVVYYATPIPAGLLGRRARPFPAAEWAALAPIAGTYYHGDGLGVNCTLTISKQGTFTFRWTGCLGTYDQKRGDADITGNLLTLSPVLPNGRAGFPAMKTRLRVISWGERLYLIPQDEIVRFCSAINQGDEPRTEIHGAFYLRDEDWKKKAAGAPDVPADGRKYLLKAPVVGEVTERIGAKEGWINVGANRGLLPGMELVAQNYRDKMFSTVEVMAVKPGRSKVRCLYPDGQLARGQKVTSLFHCPPELVETPLVAAVMRGDVETVRRLLESGRGKVSDRDSTDQRTLLELAIDSGRHTRTMVSLLLEKGADVKNDVGPLCAAARRGDVALVRLLIAKGASARTHSGRTPLHCAVGDGYSPGSLPIVKLLIESGADVNAIDEDGRTPLLEAVYAGDAAIVRGLLERGADVYAKHKQGATPLSEAISRADLYSDSASNTERTEAAAIASLLRKYVRKYATRR